MNFYHRQSLDLFYEAEKHGLPYFCDEPRMKMINAIEEVSFDDLVVVCATTLPHANPESVERYLNGPWEPEVDFPQYLEALLVRSGGSLLFQEQAIDILRATVNWPMEEAVEIINLMKEPESVELKSLLDKFASSSLTSPYYFEWWKVNLNIRGCMVEIWNYLIKCAPYLVSYKFSFASTLHAYQTAYNISHN